MPAPPDESEPAMVSATGIVIAQLAAVLGFAAWAYPVLTRQAIASKFACHSLANLALLVQIAAPGDDRNGSLFRSVQVQARPILCGGQRARRGRDRLGDLFHRRRLRPPGQVLCR